jgi:hypothetical protein
MKPTTRKSAFSCLISPMTPLATWPGTRWVSIAAPAPFAGLGRVDDGSEAMVRFVLFLGDFVDACWKARELLDRHHMELGGEFPRQLDRP